MKMLEIMIEDARFLFTKTLPPIFEGIAYACAALTVFLFIAFGVNILSGEIDMDGMYLIKTCAKTLVAFLFIGWVFTSYRKAYLQ